MHKMQKEVRHLLVLKSISQRGGGSVHLLKIANDLPIFASYYAFVIVSLT